ncbi:entericidin EcnA/B family protein [Pseudotabrizicola sp. L79]
MRHLILATMVATATLLAGCATVDGIGRDISGGANRVSGWFN